ncbi:MAG: ankyrin repeat domain-containing protein [Flavobacteriaceae bacterium]|nr:ankyrin repeat domain-containing protein [Flavobacteriaceae bacterium]
MVILLVSLVAGPTLGQELTVQVANNIKYGKTEQLEKLTTAERINECVGVKDSKKYNYLAISIKLKSMKSLRFFIEKGADIENVCADKTPLMYAAKYGQLEMVKYLIENGADLNASYRGKTTYYYARHFHHSEIRKYLKELKSH